MRHCGAMEADSASDAGSVQGGSSAIASRQPAAKAKKKKGKVVEVVPAEVDASASTSAAVHMREQVDALRTRLEEATVQIARHPTELHLVAAQAEEARDQHAAAMNSHAKQVLQIAALEHELEKEQQHSKELQSELSHQNKMLEQVLSFRDSESASDLNGLLHENAELADQRDRWQERAEMLQQERWGFVKKWKDAKDGRAGGPDAELSPDAEPTDADGDESD